MLECAAMSVEAAPPVSYSEWDWILKHRSRENDFANCFRNKLTFGVVSPCNRKSLAHDRAVWCEFVGGDKSRLLAAKVGNPPWPVLPDTFRHDYHAKVLRSLEPQTILEIGGGYGGVFIQLRRQGWQGRYINIDLPQTLALFQYVVAGTLGSCDATLIEAGMHDSLTEQSDVVYNSNSLSEMTAETVADYCRLIYRLSPRFIFHQNANRRLTKWNASRSILRLFGYPDFGKEVMADSFPLPKCYREIHRCIAPWFAGHGRYREYLFMRSF